MMRCPYPRIVSAYGANLTRVAPCQKCYACRINNRRKKTARFLLESLFHEHTTFATLTYDDEHLEYAHSEETGELLPTVNPRTLQLFIKRLRRRHSFKFAAVGEYGERFGRPHYHVLLYGMSIEAAFDLVDECWQQGSTRIDEMSNARAAYVAHYSTKKLTKHGAEGLDGKHPEFFRQSLRPAIGTSALPWLIRLHQTPGGQAHMEENGDVMSEVRIGARKYPLDRWVRDKLRGELLQDYTPQERGMEPYEIGFHDRAAEERQARRIPRGAVL